MKVLRTPDEHFKNLPDYAYEPHYVEVEGLRIHYVDEGPGDGQAVLLMHGEPSWSYLYRHMIPVILAAGHRAIAPDLPGFGRSDKPADFGDYSYSNLVRWMTEWLHAVDLKHVTLVCQDWGSLIGLRMAAENPGRFYRIVLANGGLPTSALEAPKAFRTWQKYAAQTKNLHVGQIVNNGCVSDLAPEVVAAYDAPFPDDAYKAGPRVLPALVPFDEGMDGDAANRQAIEVFAQWEKPFLTAFSDSDPITRNGDKLFQGLVPGAKGQPHVTIEQAGHFLQEDKGPELAKVVVDFIAQTPL